jgi:DNA-binding LytR/AlgR family response regulator
MIRITIGQALSNLTRDGRTEIIRCHRSYLVNLMAVNRVDGNAQGLKLSFSKSLAMTHIVPVSRSFIADFKVRFAKVS